ncbi:MAG: hypothetical protein KAJ66_05175 [Candidatus Omnitrophica bacterium]|nr:hypothetical protein [Candidatus Omnitrophota bacterium]
MEALGYIEYVVMASFMWLALLCIANFYSRSDTKWFLMAVFYGLLVLNKIWPLNCMLGDWLVADKAHWLMPIDKMLPWLMIYHLASKWIMFVFCVLFFIGFTSLLSQLVYRRVVFLLGACGLLIYSITFIWWIYWSLAGEHMMSQIVIYNCKNLLLIAGNLFFVISFSLALKQTRLKRS